MTNALSGQHNSNLARMLGKAVKLRHCPATVSALVPVAVYSEIPERAKDSARTIPLCGVVLEATESRTLPVLFLGRRLKRGSP
jgi:hypothetical protein